LLFLTLPWASHSCAAVIAHLHAVHAERDLWFMSLIRVQINPTMTNFGMVTRAELEALLGFQSVSVLTVTACVCLVQELRRLLLRPNSSLWCIPGNCARMLEVDGADTRAVNSGPLSRMAARRRLVHNEVVCTACGEAASLVQYDQGVDGKRWSCRACNWRQSVRLDSYFAASHLSLQQIVMMMYFWSHDTPQTLMAHETGIHTRETIVDWCNFFRDECENWAERNSGEIGGMGGE